MARLSPAIIAPLMDIVERTFSLTNRKPFHWSTVALKAVDPTSKPYLEEVKRRVMAWHTDLPLEIGMFGGDGQAQKHDDERRDRFMERAGTPAAGPITILGQDFNIVEGRGSRLVGVGAYLLQGCPLEGMVDLFVRHSTFLAVRGHDTDHESYPWLCWLNGLDPAETAKALRAAAKRTASLSPEPGVHAELPACVASSLYWLTGIPADDRCAQNLQPSLNKAWDYERDYLNDPAASFFAVERRHAHMILEVTDLAVIGRLQRILDLVIDPTFTIPDSIADEVREIAQSFDVLELNASPGVSSTDHRYDELSLLLARVDPQALAELERRRLRGYADRSAEQRYSCALAAHNGLLLVSPRESDSIRALAELEQPEISQPEKDFATSALYIAEIQDFTPIDQYRRIIHSDIIHIFVSSADLMPTLASVDVDRLIGEVGSAETRAGTHLLGLLAHNPPELSEKAWEWAQAVACSTPTINEGANPDGEEKKDLRALAFKLLTNVNAERFGQILNAHGWNWKPDANTWVNHYGSEALSTASRSLPLIDIISRIAPWQLLSMMSEREVSKDDIAVVLEVLNRVLLAEGSVPGPGAHLLIDRSSSGAMPGWFSVGISVEEAGITNQSERLRRQEEFNERRQGIIDEAWRRVEEARRGGASLYLTSIEAEDLDIVFDHAADTVDKWLAGIDGPDETFIRRLRRAEGFFVAVCEQLLNRDPGRGVELWRTIHAHAVTRFIGKADIPHIYHLAF